MDTAVDMEAEVMVMAMAVPAPTTQEWENMAPALSVTPQAYSGMLSTSDIWLLDSVTPGTVVTAPHTASDTSGTLPVRSLDTRVGRSVT